VDLKNTSGGCGDVSEAGPEPAADVTMTLGRDDFVAVFAGQLSPTAAFMSGRLKVKGDIGLAMKLDKMMKSLRAKL